MVLFDFAGKNTVFFGNGKRKDCIFYVHPLHQKNVSKTYCKQNKGAEVYICQQQMTNCRFFRWNRQKKWFL